MKTQTSAASCLYSDFSSLGQTGGMLDLGIQEIGNRKSTHSQGMATRGASEMCFIYFFVPLYLLLLSYLFR